jgi:hypothetical protein
MKPRTTRLLLVVIFLLAALPSFCQDRNLVILKTIYTKINDRLTVGDNPLAPNSSFLVLTDPGIVLDPQWDLSKVADQAKLAVLLGRAPKATWLYRPNTYSMEQVYKEILDTHDTPKVTLTADEQKELNRVKKLLYTNKMENSDDYNRYLQDKSDYGKAVIALEYAREDALAKGTPLDPKYQDAVDNALAQWTGPHGQKDTIEAALDSYARITGLDPGHWWTELTQQFNQQRRTGPNGAFGPVLLDSDYKRLFDDDGWMPLRRGPLSGRFLPRRAEQGGYNHQQCCS